MPDEYKHFVMLTVVLFDAYLAGRLLCQIRHYGQFEKLTNKGGWAGAFIALAIYFMGKLLLDAR